MLTRHRTLVAIGLALLLQLIVFSLIYPNLWYGPHDISDITIYFAYAAKIASGLKPYKDFAIEYPPLAVPLFTVAGNGLDFASYQRWFSFEMFVFTLAAAAAVVAAAAAIWRTRPAAVRGGGHRSPSSPPPWEPSSRTASTSSVALSIALCVWLLAVREYELAGLVLGLGFAVKLTPAVLLPVVLLLAGWNRRALWTLVLFGLAALLPFVPWLVVAPSGVEHSFLYHLDRPLQIESVLGTPLFVAHLAGAAVDRRRHELRLAEHRRPRRGLHGAAVRAR